MPDFLFAAPTFMTGVARTLDLMATFDFYNNSRTTQLADARAMWNDWRAVGQGLFNSYERVKSETKSPSGSAETAPGDKS